jgi:hypothetical protein
LGCFLPWGQSLSKPKINYSMNTTSHLWMQTSRRGLGWLIPLFSHLKSHLNDSKPMCAKYVHLWHFSQMLTLPLILVTHSQEDSLSHLGSKELWPKVLQMVLFIAWEEGWPLPCFLDASPIH